MKVGTKEMYEEYIGDLKSKRSGHIEDRDKYQSSKDYLVNNLSHYKHYIENFTNIRYSDISELNRLIPEKAMIHLANIVGINVDNIRRTINIVVEINKSIARIQCELNQIEADIIGYMVFKEIIYKFNCKSSDEIVYKGYILNIGSGMGHLRIKKINCLFNKDGSVKTKRRINWNLSNIKRREILEAGGTPYEVIERDGRKIVRDNGGEMWFVYFTNQWDYLWHWYKGKCQVLNSPYYRFRPTIYNNTSRYDGLGNVNKLKQLVTSNSELLANFTETVIDKGHRKGYNDTLWKGR